MNAALKHTMIAMATAALTISAGCKSDDGPEASETTAGAEAAATTEAKAEGSCGEGSCGEGSCSGAKHEGEGSCGEGSCG